MAVACRWFGHAPRTFMALAAVAGTLALSQGAALAQDDDYEGYYEDRVPAPQLVDPREDWQWRAQAQARAQARARWEEERRHEYFARRAAEAQHWRYHHRHHHSRYWR
jgi:hypothetical protein